MLNVISGFRTSDVIVLDNTSALDNALNCDAYNTNEKCRHFGEVIKDVAVTKMKT